MSDCPSPQHSLGDLGVDFEVETIQHIEPGNKRLRLGNGDEATLLFELLLALAPLHRGWTFQEGTSRM